VSTVMEAPAYEADGTPRARGVKLPAGMFDGRVHEAAMHQAVKVYLANQRQGTAKTKTRSFVSGGNQKPWRQKGTGRARQGSTRSPLWPGGGTAFGPQPREYRLEIPKKLRQLARHSALNARAREQSLSVIAPLAFDQPKTKQMAELLSRMGLAGEKVLLLTAGAKPNVLLSARNLQGVAVLPWQEATTWHILRARTVVVEEPALGEGALEEGGAFEAPAARPRRKKAAPAGDEGAEAGVKARAPKAKAAAKKSAARAPAKRAARTAAKKPAAKKKAAARKTARPAAKKKKPGKKKD
jgi:large subunit ribosomal protein L4